MTSTQGMGTQAVDRALAILTSFDDQDHLGISDLSLRLSLPLSTTHRLVRALTTTGLLERDHVTARYRLGTEAMHLGRRAAYQRGLPGIDRHLADLARRTGATVDLACRRGDHALVIAGSSVDGGAPYLRLDLHSTALGKTLLAWEHDNSATPPTEMAAYTDATITDADELRDELRYVRETGYAVNDGESAIGIRTIAVPLRDSDGKIHYALGLRATPEVLPNVRLANIAAELIKCARVISAELLRASP